MLRGLGGVPSRSASAAVTARCSSSGGSAAETGRVLRDASAVASLRLSSTLLASNAATCKQERIVRSLSRPARACGSGGQAHPCLERLLRGAVVDERARRRACLQPQLRQQPCTPYPRSQSLATHWSCRGRMVCPYLPAPQPCPAAAPGGTACLLCSSPRVPSRSTPRKSAAPAPPACAATARRKRGTLRSRIYRARMVLGRRT